MRVDLSDIFILLPYLCGVAFVFFNRSAFLNFTAIQFNGTIISYFVVGILGVIDYIFKLRIGQGVKFHGSK